MKLIRKVIIMFLLIFYSVCYSYEYNGKCKAGRVSFENCLDNELKSYDKQLNLVYKSFFKEFPPDELIKVETMWIRFKEADCDYMAKRVNSGKMYQFIYKACLINKTKERIADLKRSYFFAEWFNKND